MGKSKGGKYFKPPRSRKPGGRPGEGEDGEGSEEEEYTPAQRGIGQQASTVGMLPPSGSEEEDEGEGSAPAKPKQPAAAKAGQKPTAGELPPNSSDEEESSEESESSDDAPINEYLSAPRQPKKVAQTEERDPETIRKDLERLELIRKKREDDRKKRIADEGWDRFMPVSDTNKPPGHAVPSDHPSQKA